MISCALPGFVADHANDPVASQTTGGELHFSLQQVMDLTVSNASKSNSVHSHSDSDSLVLIVNSAGSSKTAIAANPYRTNKPCCVVGSGAKANWVVKDADLQPEHAMLVRIPCGAYVRSMDAAMDGLLVNGQSVDESWIHSGDSLTMGTMELIVAGIGEIEFGSCEKLETIIFRTSGSLKTNSSVEQSVSEAPCIELAPAVSSDSPFSSNSETDENPWFLSDSLVKDVQENDFESETFCVQDSDMNAVWEDISDLSVEMPGATESLDSQHLQDSVSENVFQIPRIEIELYDLLETSDVVYEPKSVFLPEQSLPAMTRKTDYSNEQASWLNELYDSIIPDEHDNAGTPPAEFREVVYEESGELEARTEPSSWLSNRPFDLSGLMKSGTDPESVSGLPEPNEQHAADLFNKFDSIDQDAGLDMEPKSSDGDLMTLDPSAELKEPTRQAGAIAIDFDKNPQPTLASSRENTETPAVPDLEFEPKNDVNDYMSQLMHRLRGGAPSPEPIKVVEKANVHIAPASPERTSSKNDVDDLTPENPFHADEFVSRSTLPEKPGSLLALRQIANQSVQSAIQRSLQNKNRNSSTMYLAGSGFAFFLSVVLFIMSGGWFDLAFIAACISSVACAMSGYMFVSVNNGIERFLEYRKQKQEDAPATSSVEKQDN